MLGVFALVVGLLWWAARPSPGQTAASTPIRPPTTTVASVPTTVNPSTTESEPSIPVTSIRTFSDGLERVPFEDFIQQVAPTDEGWIGYGTRTSSSDFRGPLPSIMRSVDGLNWEPAETNLPTSILYAVSFADGGGGGAVFAEEHAASWWESVDGTTWSEVGRVSFESGFSLNGADVMPSAVIVYATASGSAVDGTREIPGLGTYLLDTFGVRVDEPICKIDRTSNLTIFRGCGGDVVLELTDGPIAEHSAKRCLDRFRFARPERWMIMRLERDGTAMRFDTDPIERITSARATDDGFFFTVERRRQFSCTTSDTLDGPSTRVLHMGSDGSATEVAASHAQDAVYWVTPAPDGGTYLQTDGSTVSFAERGSIDFVEVANSGDEDAVFIYALQGTNWLIKRPQTFPSGFSLRRVDHSTGDWIDVNTSGRQTWPIFVSDDFVLVSELIGSLQWLVKVPLR